MASIYQRPGTHFWWIKYRDPTSQKIIRESTGFAIGGQDTRKAMELAATISQSSVFVLRVANCFCIFSCKQKPL